MKTRSEGLRNSTQPDEKEAVGFLADLVSQIGLAATVSLLAELARRRLDVLRLSGEDLKAAVLAEDIRTLDRTVELLDGR